MKSRANSSSNDPLEAALALLEPVGELLPLEFVAADVARRLNVTRCTATRQLMAAVDAGTMATRMARSRGKIVRAFRVV